MAARNRPAASVTVDQTMLAIQDLNPDAFIDRNINLMKSGQVLRLPDQAQAGTRPQREAVAEIARQTRAWKQGGTDAPAGTPRRQVDASAQPSGNEASTPAAPRTISSYSPVSLPAARANPPVARVVISPWPIAWR
ncbi:FimV/HubP family polar landmark protein [Pseudomonas oryzihabitans]|uniref:FimV/HubP family polar landmark protein n=1 Tax=Pseudomonas oryzihabitans TaxID=47885 RepID=UPI00165E3567